MYKRLMVIVVMFVSFVVAGGATILAIPINPPLQSGEASGSIFNLPVILKSRIQPSNDWNFTTTTSTLVPNTPNVPIYPWFPDGHISVLRDGSDNWMMFWSEFESYRSIGSSPYPENQTILSPTTKVLGERGGSGWDNGGSWLNSVFRLSGSTLIGFYHAEDHWYPLNPEGVAWKSIAVTYSYDNGVSWSPGSHIITAWKTKTETPEWGGAGDHSVIWDAEHQRWVCFYQEQVENGEAQIHIAISSDPMGSPGTWYKWDGVDFTIPGLGGKGVPLPAFIGREGGNPSVHQNTYLGRWVMVYGGWDGATYISSSADLIHWDAPQLLVSSDQSGRAWYPTIIGDNGDTLAGQIARLYYADIASDYSSRKFYVRTITFTRND